MPFPLGAEVVVTTLANKRGIVVQAHPDGRYRVRVERVTLWCREADLVAPPRAKARKSHLPPHDHTEASRRPVARPGRVDLHGLSVDDALARLMDEIERAIQRGADRVEVVHGKGTGRVKDAVHQRLASIPSVAGFKLDGTNPGITWVFL